MNLKSVLLAVQISVLLSLFGATTFYLQYIGLKNAYTESCLKDETTSKNTNSLPLAEEENETEKSSEEEESNDRVVHHIGMLIVISLPSKIGIATIHLMNFKEIHFEIVTPPPQA